MSPKLLLRIILTVASMMQQQAQLNRLKRKQEEEAEKRKGFQFTVRGRSSPIPIVYGKQMLGGIATGHKVSNNYVAGATSPHDKLFEENLGNSGTGSKNEFLHVEYALCHEGIEGVQWIRVNGVNYNDSEAKFNHRFRCYNSGGVADPVSTANGFPSTNTFTGVAHVSATYKLNRNEQNYGGEPDVNFLIKGRKVKTIVRSGTSPNYTYALSSSFSYNNNPVYCLLDYLMSSEFGRGLSVNDIDLPSFYHSASVCDTIVMTQASSGGKVNGGKTITEVADYAALPGNLEDRTYENNLWKTTNNGNYYYWNRTAWVQTEFDLRRDIPLYECNLTINPERSIRDNIESILDTMGLAELTWTTSGKYKLSLEYPTSVNETLTLVDTAHVFNEDNIVKDKVNLVYANASDRFNQVTIDFLNEHEDFKDDTISWPPSNSTIYTQYLTEDGNQPLKTSINSSGITDPYHAQALAEQLVRRSRTLKSIEFRTDKSGLSVEPGDFIKVTIPQNNLNNEIVRVEGIQVNSDLSVKISGYTFNHEVLAWNIANDIAYGTQPTYDFTVDAPTNLTLQGGSSLDDDQQTLAHLTWVDNNNGSSFSYDIYYRVNGTSDYIFIGNTKYNKFNLGNIEGISTNSNFDFKVFAKSPLGSLSPAAEISNVNISKEPDEPDSLSITEEQYLTNNASGIKNRLTLQWSSNNSGVLPAYYSVEYKKASESTYQVVGTTNTNQISIPDVSSGLFDFKIISYSIYGYASTPFISQHTIIGFSADPANPTGFSGNINEGQINLSWDEPTDLDVLYGGHSEIRYHNAIDSSATWDSSTEIVSSLSGNTTNKTVPTLRGTFFLRFYDAFGNYSATPAQFVSDFVDESFNFIAEYDQVAANFSGNKTNCTYNSGTGYLTLNSGQSNMVYEFASVVNLQEVVTIRLVPNLVATATPSGNLVSNYTNVSLLNRFSGEVADAISRIYISTTQDDPTGSPTWSSYEPLTIGSYKARGLKFKLEIDTLGSTNVDVTVTDLSVIVDKKDVIKTGISTSSTSADTSVLFPTAFYVGILGNSNPRIGVQTIGGSQGDRVVIVSRNNTGFVYSIYNSSGNRVQQTIDYQAIGQ